MNELRHGKCKEHEIGACPWRHDTAEVQFKQHDATNQSFTDEMILTIASTLLETFADCVECLGGEASVSLSARVRSDADTLLKTAASQSGLACLQLEESIAVCALLPVVRSDNGKEELRRAKAALDAAIAALSFTFRLTEVGGTTYVTISEDCSLYLEKLCQSSTRSEMRLQDAIEYQLRRQFHRVSCQREPAALDLLQLLETMNFLAHTPSEHNNTSALEPRSLSLLFVSLDWTNKSDVDTLVHRPAFFSAPGYKLLNASSTVSAFAKHFDCWTEILESMFSIWARSKITTSHNLQTFVKICRILGDDLASWYHHDLRSGFGWQGDALEHMFDSMSAVATSLDDYINQRFFPIARVFTAHCMNRFIAILGSVSGMDQSPQSWPLVKHPSMSPWWARCSDSRHVVLVSETFVALQEEASRASAEREAIKDEFKYKFEEWQASRRTQLQHDESTVKRQTAREATRFQAQCDERARKLIDRCLPLGTICATPLTTRLIIRTLWWRKRHRCVKLCHNLLETNRMLAAVAASPTPELVQKERTVRYTKFNKRLQRKVLGRKKILRAELAFPGEEQQLREDLAMRPVSFYYAVNDEVLADVLMVMRMLGTGRLAHLAAVWGDVRRGRFFDFSQRCFPADGSCGSQVAASLAKMFSQVGYERLSATLPARQVLPTALLLERLTGPVILKSSDEEVLPLRQLKEITFLAGRNPRLLSPSSSVQLFQALAHKDAVFAWAVLDGDSSKRAGVFKSHVREPTNVESLKRVLCGDAPDGDEADTRNRRESMRREAEEGAVQSLSNFLASTQRRSIALASGCGFLRGITALECSRLLHAHDTVSILPWLIQRVDAPRDAECVVLALLSSAFAELSSREFLCALQSTLGSSTTYEVSILSASAKAILEPMRTLVKEASINTENVSAKHDQRAALRYFAEAVMRAAPS